MYLEGFLSVITDPEMYLVILLGVAVGIVFGAIPGLTATMAITGDHFEAVTGRLLAGVVDGQDADAVLVGKLLELADDLIIAGVAVSLAADFPDFLHTGSR